MLGLVVAGSAAACAFVIGVLIHKGLAQATAWAGLVAALAGVVAAAAAIWMLVPRPSKVLLPPELEVPDWVVDRPAELSAVVRALVGGRAGTVGITTGLYGAGGFGKTMLARMVCADRRVRRRFGGRVYLVTVGRDVRGTAAVAAKVNDVIKLISGETATFTDPQLAGARLGALLNAGPRRLLVLDDVWNAEQLAPFAGGGKRCARLVTTRAPLLLAGCTAVRVDQMSPEQARMLLTAGLSSLDPAVIQGLLVATGRWPLLLRLANTILADYGRVAANVSSQAAMLLERLREGGPAVVDDLRGLDVGQQEEEERTRAVRATIGASTSLLNPRDAKWFAELGIFAENEVIPLGLAARLWQITAGMENRDDLQAAEVCERLAQLALVAQASGSARGITVHAVVRDFLRVELGRQRLADLNRMLLDSTAKDLRAAAPLDPALPAVRVAWWKLSQEDRYLWDHLIEHLLDAGRFGDAVAVACDLRWVGARLERFGPAAPAADLSVLDRIDLSAFDRARAARVRAALARAARMRTALARAAHLLAPAEPPVAVVDILHSRVADDPDWGPQVTALRDIYLRPRLVNRWQLPDLPDPAHRRVLIGHGGTLFAVAIAPNGRWLAAGGGDRTVRIWDTATGGDDETVRIWDTATGQARTTLTLRHSMVSAVAIPSDGSWLATADGGWTVQTWDPATWQKQASLPGRHGGVYAVAAAPDGSWLAAVRSRGVKIWDVPKRKAMATLTGHRGSVYTVAAAPHGRWLATGGSDGTVRIWDTATWQEQAKLTGQHGAVRAIAVAGDGSWLAAACTGAVEVWDVAAGSPRLLVRLVGHRGPVYAVAAAPHGRWLATGGSDGTVRIWEAVTDSDGETVQVGDAATRRARAKLLAITAWRARWESRERQLARHWRQRRNSAHLGRNLTGRDRGLLPGERGPV